MKKNLRNTGKGLINQEINNTWSRKKMFWMLRVSRILSTLSNRAWWWCKLQSYSHSATPPLQAAWPSWRNRHCGFPYADGIQLGDVAVFFGQSVKCMHPLSKRVLYSQFTSDINLQEVFARMTRNVTYVFSRSVSYFSRSVAIVG